jgi:hypothetical protein
VNQDQLLGAIRTILAAVGGWAAGKGYIDSETWLAITGIVVAVVPLVWSYLAHSTQAQIASVEAMPNVTKIITTDQKTADASGPKVVSTVDDASAQVRSTVSGPLGSTTF